MAVLISRLFRCIFSAQPASRRIRQTKASNPISHKGTDFRLDLRRQAERMHRKTNQPRKEKAMNTNILNGS